MSSFATTSKVQRQLAAEENERRATIRQANRIAYQERCRRRKERSKPSWVRERDAQRKANREEAIKNNEFVIVLGSKSRKKQAKTLADHIPSKVTNKFASLGIDSDSESDTEQVEQYPTLPSAKPVTTKVAPAPTGNSWATIAAKPKVEPKPTIPTGFSVMGMKQPVAAAKVHPKEPVATDNSAWSDDEEEVSTVFKRDPTMYNADGTMKSWGDLMSDDESDGEDYAYM